jgi:hypothetical protein
MLLRLLFVFGGLDGYSSVLLNIFVAVFFFGFC